MGKKIGTSVTFNMPDGQEVMIETGKLAAQADGSVVVKVGDTMLFCSAVSSLETRPGQSFFPLSVDYQEKFASAGRIPGNFFRREARLSDYEILTSRLVDRAIRPLFPDGYMKDTQIIINLISGDKETMPDAYAALAASAAIAVSDIPFASPISEVRVARINGEFVINPGRTAIADADIELIVAADMDNIMMVEGEAKECTERELIDAIKTAHEAIKVQCQAQKELAEKVGGKALTTREIEEVPQNEEVKAKVAELATDKILKMAQSALNKDQRKKALKEIKTEVKEWFAENHDEEWHEENGDFISYYFNKIQKATIRKMVLDTRVRLDGRQPNEVRNIWTEVNYLPAAHGSAIFTRGETQALMSLTLGTKTDAAMMDTALLQHYEKFILHYNFPAYSVGETKPMRGPGRREVGHANLAQRALKQVLPEDNSYVIRLVADIMESNGSSSMATVCSGSMALMDAGIKIKAPVAGIAMGMISDGENAAILSDILGDEDALGDMDFKLTGTETGITACQMDIKIEGLSYELLEEALMQAKEGRLHILGEMAKTIDTAAEDLKPHAPRMVTIVIDKSFIGAVIGPGGKVIQEMQEITGTNINIEEVDGKGIVTIASSDKDSIDAASKRINDITFKPSPGDVFDGVVKTVMPYGVFVDFKGGKSGLLHVSEISHTRIENVEDVFKEGDEVKVKLIEIDARTGKMRLSRKALMMKPDGTMPTDEESMGGGRDDRRGGGGRGGDRRGGGGRGRDDRRGGGGYRR
jgi:polyribonucleotide nucleotidyltransferase